MRPASSCHGRSRRARSHPANCRKSRVATLRRSRRRVPVTGESGCQTEPDDLSRDGVEIAYATHGAGGPAVVLVHGWAGNRTYWAHQIDHLAERHQVIAVDLGGHGESGLGRVDWTLPAFGDDVVAVVDEVDARKVVLVGHSMGGDAVVLAPTPRCRVDASRGCWSLPDARGSRPVQRGTGRGARVVRQLNDQRPDRQARR